MIRMREMCILIVLGALALIFVAAASAAATGTAGSQIVLKGYNASNTTANAPISYPIMSKESWIQRDEIIKSLSKVGVKPEMKLVVKYPSTYSLLSHVPYTPSERNQGTCGNCWVWGCTAPIEVAHDIQNGIHNRLSIQYLDSNFNLDSNFKNGWACCGGSEIAFQNFYSSKDMFIPWSNANANFQDGSSVCCKAQCTAPNAAKCCAFNSPTVPASSISTSPNYQIKSITWNYIQTSGISTSQAIKNIKSYLYSGKAVTLGFFLPDFNPFFAFWGSNSGTWDPDSYCGQPDGALPGGHLVTVVGWDDPSDSWIVLNSWGVDKSHPDGTFKLKMDMNYDCSNGGRPSYDFGYFDVTFNAPNAPSMPSGATSGFKGTSYSYTTSATDPNGYQVKYTFDWGDGTKTTTGLVNSGKSASASHKWVTGTYQVKAMATDSKGASSGYSAPLNVSIKLIRIVSNLTNIISNTSNGGK